MLQALSYIRNPPNKYLPQKPKAVKAKCPNEKQLKSKKFSKSNLKYIVTQFVKEGKESTVLSLDPNKTPLQLLCERDKVIVKNIQRFYKSADPVKEALTDFGFIKVDNWSPFWPMFHI